MIHWREIELHHMLCAALKLVELEACGICAFAQRESEAAEVVASHGRWVELWQDRYDLANPEQTQSFLFRRVPPLHHPYTGRCGRAGTTADVDSSSVYWSSVITI